MFFFLKQLKKLKRKKWLNVYWEKLLLCGIFLSVNFNLSGEYYFFVLGIHMVFRVAGLRLTTLKIKKKLFWCCLLKKAKIHHVVDFRFFFIKFFETADVRRDCHVNKSELTTIWRKLPIIYHKEWSLSQRLQSKFLIRYSPQLKSDLSLYLINWLLLCSNLPFRWSIKVVRLIFLQKQFL